MMGRKRYKKRPITGFIPSFLDELEVLEAGRRVSRTDPVLDCEMDEPLDQDEQHFRSIMEG